MMTWEIVRIAARMRSILSASAREDIVVHLLSSCSMAMIMNSSAVISAFSIRDLMSSQILRGGSMINRYPLLSARWRLP